MPDSKTAAASSQQTIPDLSRLAPAEIRRTLEKMTDSAARSAAIREALKSLPPDQWKSWVQSWQGTGRGSPHKADIAAQASHYALMNEVFGAVAAENPVGFMAAQNSKGERNNDGESMLRVFVMMKWAEQEPAAAKEFLQAQLASGKASPGLKDAARFMATVLARQADGTVLEWASQLPEDVRGEAAGAALTQLAAADPAGTAVRLAEFSGLPGLDADNLAGEIAATWARDHPAEALAWAAAQTGATQKNGLEGVLEVMAAKDFDAALAAAKALPGDAATTGLSTLIRKAPAVRAAELAGLVEQQPEGNARAEASAGIMSAWTHQDPEAASVWMQRQPRGEIQDSAITAFVRWADVRDPEAALLWAGSISDPAKRMDAVGHIIGQLRDKAPSAVQPWLESNTSLTPAERTEIQQKLQRGR